MLTGGKVSLAPGWGVKVEEEQRNAGGSSPRSALARGDEDRGGNVFFWLLQGIN